MVLISMSGCLNGFANIEREKYRLTTSRGIDHTENWKRYGSSPLRCRAQLVGLLILLPLKLG